VIVHLGIVLVTMGLIGSGFFKQERVVLMNPGEVVIIAGEPLRFDGVEPVEGPNYLALRGHLTLLKSREELLPERRRYPVQEMPTTESAIQIRPWRDLYVVLGEQQGERFAVQLHHFPLLQFLWGGTFVMLAGLGLALSTRQRRTKPQENGHA
jgi:cytochrome c-type biogenesis protein CcmF